MSFIKLYKIYFYYHDNIFVTGVDNNDIGLLKFNPSVGLGINDGINKQDVFIYPNPTAETFFLQINSKDGGDFRFEVVSIQGQILSVLEKSLQAGNKDVIQFNMDGLSKDFYFLNIYSPIGGCSVHYFMKD